ncbi:cytochrome P450 isoform B [Micractinium conductrix]|uniref:Cytochrome P450 isoform B n=1 Tax=Micractinium conductrix TaxID=554055 RepID=A0A2P6VQP4_9CHLO|nr:cytochrome P450 isoform B [Micractinium conductrix]|eukprot:PSC76426.1 cytochrome P450 isoform B [Micractinium conductrix]
MLALLLGVALSAVAARVASYLAFVRRLAALPSPPPAAHGRCTLLSRLRTALAGHAGELTEGRHHRTVLRWDGLVGPVFRLNIFWARAVVVTQPELVHQLLRGGAGMDKAQLTYQVINPLLSLFSASSHSPYWRLVRKGVAPGFSMRSLRASFPHIQGVITSVLEALGRLGPDAAFDVDSLLMRSTMDVIGRVGFECSFGGVQGFHATSPGGGAQQGEEDDIFHIITASLEEVNRRWGNPLRARFLWWLPEVRAAERHWRAFQRRMHALAADIQRRGQPAAGDESLAAHLLRLRYPHTGQPLSVDRLVPELSTFFVAGIDTTAHTMAWTLYLLAQHPEAEAQRPEPRAVEFDDVGRLSSSFFGAVIKCGQAVPPLMPGAVNKESMRLLPVDTDGTAIEFPHDIQLAGHTIPAYTMIWVHPFTTHNSPRYWEQPELFLPERFLQPGAEYAAAGPQGRAGGSDAGQKGRQHTAEVPGSAATAGTADGGGGSGGAWASPARSPTSSAVAGAAAGTAAGAAAGAAAAAPGSPASTATSISRQAAAVAGASGQPLRFFPFSQGPRDCIGQSLAKLNYTATLAALLGLYNFRLDPQSAGPDGVREVVKLTEEKKGFGILLEAVLAANASIVETLSNPYLVATVFAPDDHAFRALFKDVTKKDLREQQVVQTLLAGKPGELKILKAWDSEGSSWAHNVGLETTSGSTSLVKVTDVIVGLNGAAVIQIVSHVLIPGDKFFN